MMSSLFHNCGWKSKERSIYVITKKTSAFICKSDILHNFMCVFCSVYDEVKPQFFLSILLAFFWLHPFIIQKSAICKSTAYGLYAMISIHPVVIVKHMRRAYTIELLKKEILSIYYLH